MQLSLDVGSSGKSLGEMVEKLASDFKFQLSSQGLHAQPVTDPEALPIPRSGTGSVHGSGKEETRKSVADLAAELDHVRRSSDELSKKLGQRELEINDLKGTLSKHRPQVETLLSGAMKDVGRAAESEIVHVELNDEVVYEDRRERPLPTPLRRRSPKTVSFVEGTEEIGSHSPRDEASPTARQEGGMEQQVPTPPLCSLRDRRGMMALSARRGGAWATAGVASILRKTGFIRENEDAGSSVSAPRPLARPVKGVRFSGQDSTEVLKDEFSGDESSSSSSQSSPRSPPSSRRWNSPSAPSSSSPRRSPKFSPPRPRQLFLENSAQLSPEQKPQLSPVRKPQLSPEQKTLQLSPEQKPLQLSPELKPLQLSPELKPLQLSPELKSLQLSPRSPRACSPRRSPEQQPVPPTRCSPVGTFRRYRRASTGSSPEQSPPKEVSDLKHELKELNEEVTEFRGRKESKEPSLEAQEVRSSSKSSMEAAPATSSEHLSAPKLLSSPLRASSSSLPSPVRDVKQMPGKVAAVHRLTSTVRDSQGAVLEERGSPPRALRTADAKHFNASWGSTGGMAGSPRLPSSLATRRTMDLVSLPPPASETESKDSSSLVRSLPVVAAVPVEKAKALGATPPTEPPESSAKAPVVRSPIPPLTQRLLKVARPARRSLPSSYRITSEES